MTTPKLAPDYQGNSLAMTLPPTLSNISALVFDVIGTCCDPITPIAEACAAHVAASPDAFLKAKDWMRFARDWMSAVDQVIHDLAAKGECPPLAQIHRSTLMDLLVRDGITEWDTAVQQDVIDAWSKMRAWKDTTAGLDALRTKYTTCALSNASARNLVESNKANSMIFDITLPSNVTGQYKPHPEAYQSAIRAVQFEPHQAAMVAAHANDLEGAASQGLRTIYVRQNYPGNEGDPQRLKKFDLVVEEGGIWELARRLGAA